MSGTPRPVSREPADEMIQEQSEVLSGARRVDIGLTIPQSLL
jgi:hypothetical protein